jgi:DNA invertase Pin-like site-specific DNA recombinase
MINRIIDKSVIYRRTSTEEQVLSIDAQDETGARLAAQRGWKVARTYTEHESGGNNDRPELAKALAHARRIGAVLIVAKLDRLARDQRFLMALYDGNVPLVFGDLPEVDGTPAGRLIVQIMASVAEFERRRMGERMKDWHRVRKAKGLRSGTPRNLVQEHRIKGAKCAAAERAKRAVDEMADVIMVAAELRTAGRSLREIARALNVEGYVTRRGKSWTHPLVLRLLGRKPRQ